MTTPAAEDMARSLEDDLRLCKAATPGPWQVCEYAEEGAAEARFYVGFRFDAGQGWWASDSTLPGAADAAFIAAARTGWPAAARRALAAEGLLRRACTATGPDGYAELTAALDEARALLGLPRPYAAPEGHAEAPRAAGGCLSDPDAAGSG